MTSLHSPVYSKAFVYVRVRVHERECVLMRAGVSRDATVAGSEQWQQESRLVDLAHEEDGAWGHRRETSCDS